MINFKYFQLLPRPQSQLPVLFVPLNGVGDSWTSPLTDIAKDILKKKNFLVLIAWANVKTVPSILFFHEKIAYTGFSYLTFTFQVNRGFQIHAIGLLCTCYVNTTNTCNNTLESAIYVMYKVLGCEDWNQNTSVSTPGFPMQGKRSKPFKQRMWFDLTLRLMPIIFLFLVWMLFSICSTMQTEETYGEKTGYVLKT